MQQTWTLCARPSCVVSTIAFGLVYSHTNRRGRSAPNAVLSYAYLTNPWLQCIHTHHIDKPFRCVSVSFLHSRDIYFPVILSSTSVGQAYILCKWIILSPPLPQKYQFCIHKEENLGGLLSYFFSLNQNLTNIKNTLHITLPDLILIVLLRIPKLKSCSSSTTLSAPSSWFKPSLW